MEMTRSVMNRLTNVKRIGEAALAQLRSHSDLQPYAHLPTLAGLAKKSCVGRLMLRPAGFDAEAVGFALFCLRS